MPPFRTTLDSWTYGVALRENKFLYDGELVVGSHCSFSDELPKQILFDPPLVLADDVRQEATIQGHEHVFLVLQVDELKEKKTNQLTTTAGKSR